MSGQKAAGLISTAAMLALAAGSAGAHPGGVMLSGRGTAAVDGIVSPGEWATAGALPFQANAPGGGTVPAVFRVMNDDANVYFSLTVALTGADQTLALAFDNDHDGSAVAEEGDDGLAFGAFTGGPGLNDNVRSSRPPCPVGSFCAFRDTEPGGTIDGTGALQTVGGETHIEISHPLDSADDLNDFSLAFGDTVGFAVQYAVFGAAGAVFTRPAGAFGPINSDLVVLAPLDVTPPDLSVSASPSILWPPSGRLEPVTLLVEASDAGGIAALELLSVSSSDDGGDEDIAGATVGTDDRSLLLRAEREGSNDGRTYKVTYRATDLAGNEAVASTTVGVPHDRRFGPR